ncbi:MAG: MBL fold metallo-hydrolase [Bacteroidetes bacterium]|nr:MBL fold metallo-hydrolase [Bacteroidota bacterium]
MKKTVKRTLVGLGVVFIMIVAFFGTYLLKAKFEIRVMTPMETREIDKKIVVINDSYVNLFLIKDSNQYIAVDGGNNMEAVSKELKNLNIDPRNIIAVVLTHTDSDHVAALNLFKKAGVYFSKQEEPLINGGRARFLLWGNSIAAKKYTLLDDQQTITIKNTKIKGILTPGHTPGSMCYLVNDKYLFTGDAISLKNDKIGKFNKFFNMDTKMATESIARITAIPTAEYIFTAHYGYTSDYKNAVKDWKNE